MKFEEHSVYICGSYQQQFAIYYQQFAFVNKQIAFVNQQFAFGIYQFAWRTGLPYNRLINFNRSIHNRQVQHIKLQITIYKKYNCVAYYVTKSTLYFLGFLNVVICKQQISVISNTWFGYFRFQKYNKLKPDQRYTEDCKYIRNY